MSAGHVARRAVRVAFQGAHGAYGELAIHRHWRGTARAVASRTFRGALARVRAGRADRAVIPIWNSTIGEIRPARAALAAARGLIEVDQIEVEVEHCLLALPGATLDGVRFVGSHPAALAQCARALSTRAHLRSCAAYDTGGAARELRELAELGDASASARRARPWHDGVPYGTPRELAVIAGAGAARRYGLDILATDIADDAANATRFAVVAAREDA